MEKGRDCRGGKLRYQTEGTRSTNGKNWTNMSGSGRWVSLHLSVLQQPSLNRVLPALLVFFRSLVKKGGRPCQLSRCRRSTSLACEANVPSIQYLFLRDPIRSVTTSESQVSLQPNRRKFRPLFVACIRPTSHRQPVNNQPP